LYTAKSLGLEPKRLRPVYSRQGEPAVLSLVECIKNGGANLLVEPALYIFAEHDYTQEVKTYYA
jgi:tRNA1(Val) A37 N6-methylase TrmN6